jgi:hypothetical protein
LKWGFDLLRRVSTIEPHDKQHGVTSIQKKMGKNNSKSEANRPRALTKKSSFLTPPSFEGQLKAQTDHFMKKYPDGYMSKEEFIGIVY